MRRVLEKLDEKYNAADEEYTHSEDFIHLLVTKEDRIKKDESNIYVYIKDVIDHLKLWRRPKEKKKTNKSLGNSLKDASVEKDTRLNGNLTSSSASVPVTACSSSGNETNIVDLEESGASTEKKASSKHIRKLEKMLVVSNHV